LATLLAGTRLWSGKSDVVRATVKVATNWSAALVEGAGDESALLGTSDGARTWKPITVSPNEYDNDLFIGDAWFGRSQNEVDFEEGRQTIESSEDSMDVDNTDMDIDKESSNETTIHFEEDTLLDDENPPTATIDDAARVEEKSLILTYTGLCRLLLIQAFPTARALLSVSEDEVLPYRATVLQSLTDLLKCLHDSVASNAQKKYIFQLLSGKLISVFDTQDTLNDGKTAAGEPPLIVARSIDCFAACFWKGFGGDESVNPEHSNTLGLSKKFLRNCGQEQPAWTVREAAALGCASLASNSHSFSLRKHEVISTMVDCVSQALRDRKFWKVRYD
jgi:hypothetical protein